MHIFLSIHDKMLAKEQLKVSFYVYNELMITSIQYTCVL